MAIDEAQRAEIKGTPFFLLILVTLPSPISILFHRALYTISLRTRTPTNKTFTTARLTARDEHVRQSWVKSMEARLVRDELEKCQKAEGVNGWENCRWLSEKYLGLLTSNKVRPLFFLHFFPWV